MAETIVDRVLKLLDEQEQQISALPPGPIIVPSPDELIQSCARVLMESVLRLIESDPHHWSSRPCATCRAISGIVGRPFGCSRKET